MPKSRGRAKGKRKRKASDHDYARHKHKKRDTSYIREFIFGVEDGLVTSFGVVIGVSAAAAGVYVILLAGLVAMFSGAVSMAAGTYLSIKSQHEVYEREMEIELRHSRAKTIIRHEYGLMKSRLEMPFRGAGIMALSFLVGAFIPLAPYILGTDWWHVSVFLTGAALFAFGAAKTYYTKRSWIKSGTEMLLLGIIAGLAGWAIGSLFVI